MNPRVITIIIGAITLIFGLCGLIFPEFVMSRVIGTAVLQSFSANFVIGEVRAAYGGLFTVMGVYTLLSGMDPALHRARLLFLGLLWLGLCGGRLIGVVVDGSPGLIGWFSVAFELIVGAALVLVAQTAPARSGAAIV